LDVCGINKVIFCGKENEIISFLFLVAEISTPPSPRTRPSTLLAHSSVSNGQFYGNNSSVKSQSPHHTFNPNLTLISIMQQPFLHHHHAAIPYNTETLSNDNQQMFDG